MVAPRCRLQAEPPRVNNDAEPPVLWQLREAWRRSIAMGWSRSSRSWVEWCMNEVKRAFVEALERSADELEKIVKDAKLPDDFRESFARLKHPDFGAKVKLRFPVEVMRGRAASVRRGDIKQGDWPPFQPTDASQSMEMHARVIEEANAWSGNEVLKHAVREAVRPLREVVEKYGERTEGGWRFLAEHCDPMPEWNPPPTPGQ